MLNGKVKMYLLHLVLTLPPNGNRTNVLTLVGGTIPRTADALNGLPSSAGTVQPSGSNHEVPHGG